LMRIRMANLSAFSAHIPSTADSTNPFRPLVQDVAERMQVPLDFPAVTAIATLAGVTNRRALIQPKEHDDSWKVVPNLWGAIIGPPGVLKTPLMNSIMHPARLIEEEWRLAYQSDKANYQNALELHEAEVKAWQAKDQQALKAGKPRLPKPSATLEKPVARRLLTSDATFEKLHELLSENPTGVLVIRDELTGWLAGLERQGREQERGFYLECWIGDSSFTIDRIGRGSIHVPHACISLFGGIQPARLRQYLAEALRDGPSNDGLIQRFQLMVWPEMPKVWNYVDRKPDSLALQKADRIYRQLASMDVESPVHLQFDREAQSLFAEFLTDLEKRIRGDELHPAMQAHLAKYRCLMPSLALLFALADGRRDYVPMEETKLACDWCDYLETHARRVYACQVRPAYSAAVLLSKRLANGWKRAEGQFSVRDVYQNGWQSLNSPESARGAVNLLQEYDWVRQAESEPGKAGRPGETYRINPRIWRLNAGN
jgi:putative DNA primase/helicase